MRERSMGTRRKRRGTLRDSWISDIFFYLSLYLVLEEYFDWYKFIEIKIDVWENIKFIKRADLGYSRILWMATKYLINTSAPQLSSTPSQCSSSTPPPPLPPAYSHSHLPLLPPNLLPPHPTYSDTHIPPLVYDFPPPILHTCFLIV